MTSRQDILPSGERGFRRLSYICRCGWIDWGHANGNGARRMINKIRLQRNELPATSRSNLFLNGSPAFLLEYTQTMRGMGMTLPLNTRKWIVRKGLSVSQSLEVAYAIFRAESWSFESFQNRPLFRLRIR